MSWLTSTEAIVGLVVAVISAGGGVAGTLMSRRTSKEDLSLRRFDVLYDQQQDQINTLIEWVGIQGGEIKDLRRHVTEVESRFDAIERKYSAALRYIRDLWDDLARFITRSEIKEPPEVITPDL